MVSCFLACLKRSLCELAATDLQVLVVVSLHQRAGPGGRSKQHSSFIHPLHMYTTQHVCTTLYQDGTSAYFDRLSFLGYFTSLGSGSEKLKIWTVATRSLPGLGGVMLCTSGCVSFEVKIGHRHIATVPSLELCRSAFSCSHRKSKIHFLSRLVLLFP